MWASLWILVPLASLLLSQQLASVAPDVFQLSQKQLWWEYVVPLCTCFVLPAWAVSAFPSTAASKGLSGAEGNRAAPSRGQQSDSKEASGDPEPPSSKYAEAHILNMESGRFLRSNTLVPMEFENELAHGHFVMLSAPWQLSSEESKDDPNVRWQSDYFGNKRRRWELRLKIVFKKRTPAAALRIASSPFEHTPLGPRQIALHRWVLSLVSPIICDLYNSPGESPECRPNGELEAPLTSVPICEADQYIAPMPAGSVDLMDSAFPGLGIKKVDDPSRHREFLREAVFETGETHTFAFWGISRFFDFLRWRMSVPLTVGASIDTVNGPPPIFLFLYELRPGANGEKRHVPSRMGIIWRVAVWSDQYPPTQRRLRQLFELAGAEPGTLAERQQAMLLGAKSPTSCSSWLSPCGVGIRKLVRRPTSP